jgi:hypothetical protein
MMVGVLLLHQLPLPAETEPNDRYSSRRWEQPDLLSLEQQVIAIRLPAKTAELRPLGAREIACLAACRWHPAKSLRQRADTIQRLFCNEPHSSRQGAAVVVSFLQAQAAHQEDLGAASAMRAYYSSIGVGEQQHWIDAGTRAVELMDQKQHSLLDQGLAAGIDLSSLQRKELDLLDQKLQAESQLRQLQDLLTGLTGLDCELSGYLVEPLAIQETELDCEALVAQAFRQRCDLISWQHLYCHINETTAPFLVEILSSVAGSFGLPIPTTTAIKRLLCLQVDGKVLADSLRRELGVLIQTHQAVVEQSVREKCEQLQLAYERQDIAQQRIQNWLSRLSQLDRLESLGQPKPDQRMLAEAGLLESRVTEVTRRLEAKLAEVSLAESVGGLAVRCCHGQAWLPTGF